MVYLGSGALSPCLRRISASQATSLFSHRQLLEQPRKHMVTMMHAPVPKAAESLLEFLNASPTPFHAVHNASTKLEDAGFQRVYEKSEDWDLKEGGKYFFTRNQSSLIAFTLPKGWKEGAGFSIVGTHTDSPCLKVRPVSKRSKVGYLQVGVETYGGGIWHTWFDRDLSLAGRVVVTDKSGEKFTSRLVNLKRPLLRVPSLAIHLDRTVNDSFKFNQETQFVPILGLISSQLNAASKGSIEEKYVMPPGGSSVQTNHHPALLELLANEISVAPEEIHDFELCLYDVQPSQAGGIQNEFVFSPRLDNLMSSFCAVEALVESVSAKSALPLEGNVNVIALFNHEEIGSVSTSGAESSLLPSLFQRLSPSPAAHAQSIAQSFLVSADMGHAVHPNYTSSHEEVHRPEINGGLVLKTNAKQRYATDAIGTFLIRKLVEKKGGRIQEFEVRNDMPCGSTVGPMLSKLGVRTVDVGMPMLSMHSIRETAGTKDVQSYIDAFQSLFEGFTHLDASLKVD